MTHQGTQSTPPVDVSHQHEPSDVNVRVVLWFTVILVVVGILIHVFLLVYLRVLAAYDRETQPEPAVIARDQTPPSPRLQAAPMREFAEFRATENRLLSSYEWLDPNEGVVRIPVDQAMQLLVERGLPEPQSSRSSQAAQPEQAAADDPTEPAGPQDAAPQQPLPDNQPPREDQLPSDQPNQQPPPLAPPEPDAGPSDNNAGDAGLDPINDRID